MRNIITTLDKATTIRNIRRMATFRDILDGSAPNRLATFHYVKRDGSTGTYTGTVLAYGGAAHLSNAYVKVDTDKGPRTLNLSGIRSIEAV